MNKLNPSFEEAINAASLWCTAWEKDELSDEVLAERVAELAKRYQKTSAQIALAWLCNKQEVTSPIVGVSSSKQLLDLMTAPSIELDDSDNQYLEELYKPLENLLSLGMS